MMARGEARVHVCGDRELSHEDDDWVREARGRLGQGSRRKDGTCEAREGRGNARRGRGNARRGAGMSGYDRGSDKGCHEYVLVGMDSTRDSCPPSEKGEARVIRAETQGPGIGGFVRGQRARESSPCSLLRCRIPSLRCGISRKVWKCYRKTSMKVG